MIKTILEGDKLEFNLDKGVKQVYNLRKGQKEVIDLIDNNFLENILFLAPTAYGKTIGALYYIIKVYNEVNSRSIYCAPLKALTAEVVETVNKLGLKVLEDTGDDRKDPQKDYEKCDVLIITPERFDVVLRNPKNHELLSSLFSLIVIDETHTVHTPKTITDKTSRGVNLESIITKIKYHTSLAIMGLSATIDNVKDVAEFLNAKYIYVPKTERPVKQNLHIQYYSGKFYEAIKERNGYLRSTINDIIAKNGQALIFCSSRKRCEDLAKEFSGYNINDPVMLAHKSNYSWHHAGLQSFQRKEIESLFLNNKLRFIFCTPTLAMGINLPAFSVIIYDTTRWNGLLSDEELIDKIEVQQMVGRGGRPQYGQKECDVYVYVNSRFQPYVIEENIILSGMLGAMKVVMNEWITSSIDTKEEIKICLNGTLLSKQIDKDIMYEGAGEALSWLTNNGFCQYENGVFTPSFLGKMTALFYIRPETALHFKALESVYNERKYSDLELTAKLISTQEFLSNIRVEEKDKELVRLCANEFTENKIDLKLFDERILKAIPLIFKQHFETKYNVKIKLYRNDSITLHSLMERIFTSAGVIIYDKGLKERIKTLKVMVQNKTLDRSLAILRCVKGIGEVRINRLIANNVNTPEKFLKRSNIELKLILGIKEETISEMKETIKQKLRSEITDGE